MKNFKYFTLLVLFPAFVFSALVASKFVFTPRNSVSISLEPKLTVLKIGKVAINVEIVATPEKRAKGLSDRESLPKNQGMLFVFPISDYHSFWMKNMRFGLDFIWISNSKVVEVTKEVKPEDYEPPKVLVPAKKADQVLEINDGMAERLGIEIGDEVELK